MSPLFQGVALIGAVAIASSRGAIGNGGDGRAIRRLLRSRLSAPLDKPVTLDNAARDNTALDHAALDNTADSE